MIQKELIYKAFDCLFNFVISDGGDGTGWIVTKDYRNIYKMFIDWLNDNKIEHNFDLDNVDDGGFYILLSDRSNENIMFCKKIEDVDNSKIFDGDYIIRF